MEISRLNRCLIQMLDVEDTWRELVYPWLIKNKPSFSLLRGRWGSDYCLEKFLQAARENTASLPLIHGLISRCSTKITYYFLAVEDPEYQRWLPICRVDYTHVIANYGTPVLILRKSDSQLGYLDRETLCFSQSEDISHFIWAKGASCYTPIRVIDKSQSYISKVIKKAKNIYEEKLWNGNSDDDYFAQDTIISASELLPRWGSKEMFLAHLPIHAVASQWAIQPDAAEIAKPFRTHGDDIQNSSEIRAVSTIMILGGLNMTNNGGDTYNVSQAGAVGKYARSDGNTFIQSEKKQALSEAAVEIQRLLKQLEQTNPDATEAEKLTYINDETTPSFKRRVVGALQAGGEAAIEEFLDNPYVNVGKAAVKGWIQPE